MINYNHYNNHILKPTALVQFEHNKTLQFKYNGLYDLYIEENLRYNKPKWAGRMGIAEEKPHLTQEIEIINEQEQINEINNKLNNVNFNNIFCDNSTSNNSKSQSGNNTTNVIVSTRDSNTIAIKRIKPKKQKINNNVRSNSTNCPYCLSKLNINSFGLLECSGDKLQLWEQEFVKYGRLNDKQKLEYLKKYTDAGIFLDLYERYSYVDEKGNKRPLVCVYSNRLFNPISRFVTHIYDPVLVYQIERSLGRLLTDLEKEGDSEIFREGNRYFDDYKKGRIKVKIPKLQFPQNFV